MPMKNRSPWSWIPSLYFAQGIPYVVAMTVAVVMYKRLGISNTDIALYTSWLYLPWVIKPFWSPFVDIIRTKRWWIVTMQLLIGAGFAAVAFLLPLPHFFQSTLAVLWLIAFSSATHDIAADGFYMLALDSGEQSFFVGIRSTFYRLAMIAGQGLLIIVAGALETATGTEPVHLHVSVTPGVELSDARTVVPQPLGPSGDEISLALFPERIYMLDELISADSLDALRRFVERSNVENGFVPEVAVRTAGLPADEGWWERTVSAPLKRSLQSAFGVEKKEDVSVMSGNAAVAMLRLYRRPADGERFVFNISMDKGSKDITLLSADRLTFDSSNWDKPAYALFSCDSRLDGAAEAVFKVSSGNIPFAWSVTFLILSGFFIAIFIYHRFSLPRPLSDSAAVGGSPSGIMKDFVGTFVSYFRKPGIGTAIAFMLLYRLAEAMLVKMTSPFLLDSREMGGLALSTAQVGIVYGTVGVIALTLGGILGGIVVSRRGLKFWLWPMALAITLPNAAYLFLAWVMPENFIVINIAVAIEQFGYGFGFTAYMLYLIYISDGEHKTAHYALCTGFMALGMMLPGMIAGWLQEAVGYQNFFIWVMICTLPTLLLIPFIKVDPSFGRKG